MISRVFPVPRRLDLTVLGCALGLSALGVLFIASTAVGGRFQGLASRQAIWIAVGLGGMAAAVLMDYRMLLKASFVLYAASLLPLLYLLAFGQRIANVRSWIRFGGFQFQPAELAKIATALLVAYLFENEDDASLRLSAFVKLGAFVGIPFLIVFAQPDLGLALTFLPLLVVGFFYGRTSGASSKGLAAAGGAVSGLLTAFVGILTGYVLGDPPVAVLIGGSVGGAIAGTIGGLVGSLTVKKT